MAYFRYSFGGWGTGLGQQVEALVWESGIPVPEVSPPGEPPPEDDFTSQTPPIAEEQKPWYTLPVEIFKSTVPIIVRRPEPVYMPIPGELPPCYPQDYQGPLPAGMSYCPEADNTEIYWALGLLGLLTLGMAGGARRQQRRSRVS